LFREAIEKIRELRERANRYGDQLSKNEFLTRYVLIDPFLRLLGWDVENPELVRPEFSTTAGRPDYALLVEGKPIAFIGAKSLGRQEDLQQYISYCVSEGVKYFIATDGAKWEVYDTQILKPLIEKRIAEWDLTRDEPGEVLRRSFILFRYSPFKEVVAEPLTRTEVSKQPERPIEEGASLTSIKPKPGMDLKFHEIVFPDGRLYELKKWRDILLRTVDWLVVSNRLARERVPVKVGRKRYLINIEPKHPTGEKFRDPKEVTGYFVECNYGVPSIFRYSVKLLRDFGVDPSGVFLV